MGIEASEGRSVEGEKVRLGYPAALLVGWLALTLATVVALAFRGGELAFSGRLVRYGFVTGHLLALALLSAGVTFAYERFLGTRRWVGYALLFAGAALVAFGVLDRDLSNFFATQEEKGGHIPWPLIAPVGVGLCLTAGIWVTAWLTRIGWRLLPLLGGLGLAGLCQTDFLLDYRGIWFVASLTAATLTGVALRGLPLPLRLRTKLTPRIELGVLSAATLAAALSLFVAPRPSVWRSLFDIPGSLLAPYLAGFHHSDFGGNTSKVEGEWFKSREHAPSIPPSVPPLVQRDPIVIVITVDAMRGDLVTTDKYKKELPNYARLRHEGINFEMARSPSPATLTTLTSLFTGKYYSQIYWRMPKPHVPMADHEPTKFLAELLKEHGVRTLQVAVMHAPVSRGGARGFDKVVSTKKGFAPAKKAMDLILRELGRDARGPTFLYSHLADPHFPYQGGKAGDPKFKRYVGDVAAVDKQLGRLYAYLKSHHLLERTVLILSADHGEAFGEHGSFFHAWGNFDEVVHVPLLIWAPGVHPRAIPTPVSLMDVRPTVLDLFGVATPGTDMGQSLVPYLRGETPHLTRPIVVDAGRRIQSMVFPENIKVTRDLNKNTLEVYDLNVDPGEKHDLADDPRYGKGYYVDALAKFFDVHTLSRPGYNPPWRKF